MSHMENRQHPRDDQTPSSDASASGIDLDAIKTGLLEELKNPGTEFKFAHYELASAIEASDGGVAFVNAINDTDTRFLPQGEKVVSDRHWFTYKDGKIVLTPPHTDPSPKVNIKEIIYIDPIQQVEEWAGFYMGKLPAGVRGAFVLDIEGSNDPYVVTPVFNTLGKRFGEPPYMIGIRVGMINEHDNYHELDTYNAVDAAYRLQETTQEKPQN